MASNRFVILAIAVILLPTIAIATEYVVGDDKGWIPGFDYAAWAKDKMFNVGDVLGIKINEESISSVAFSSNSFFFIIKFHI